tara:strand:+ start:48 stop:365 length:318 start_codon:yes stop_codon:yes gene_type:complete
MKTFKQFQKTKVLLSSANEIDAKRIIDITGYEEPTDNPRFMLVYEGDLYIEAIMDKKGGWIYTLCIIKEECSSTNLEKLEKILYKEWYVDEVHYWETNKKLTEEA